MSFIKITDHVVTLHVVLVPKSSRDSIMGVLGEELKITITAPPIDGQANAYLCKYLSKLFKATKTNVKILRGETNKHKVIEITNYGQIPSVIQELLPE